MKTAATQEEGAREEGRSVGGGGFPTPTCVNMLAYVAQFTLAMQVAIFALTSPQ